jgi:2-dehydropantoate 2-reductase
MLRFALMQIIVLGAGAIGSLYGAKLAVNNDVTLIGRAGHVRAIEENGLQIEGIETKTIPVRAVTHISELQPDTLILLTTKVPAAAMALKPIAPIVRDDTTIVALQNGLESAEIARRALGDRGVVLRGISQFGAIFERAGTIRYMAKGYTLLEDHQRSERIAAVLNDAGLDCRIAVNIRTEVWRKVVFNCVVNPITTIIGSEVGEIVDSRLNRLKQLVIEECVAVAEAEGVELETDLAREINAAYAGSRNLVSMRQDILRGRTTEIDYLNGAVAEVGSRRGVECPVNRGLTDIIKGMEATSQRLSRVAAGAATVGG